MVREQLAEEDGVSEVPMFGGLAFMLDGNITVALTSDGGLLARVGPDGTERALKRSHAELAVMGKRTMKGWVKVAADGLRTRRSLAAWVRESVRFTRTLPPKG